MYKAFMEFIGTRLLGQTLSIMQKKEIDPASVNNFDDNVLFYALGQGKKIINEKFNAYHSLKDTRLPPDLIGKKQDIIHRLLKVFDETNKLCAFINLTNSESKALRLVATKLWTPQMITVPTPNAVPVKHKRFLEYGGVNHLELHPYA